ncbi:V-type ATP synthase subunit E [Candidatus Gracilibacteria bacterium]|nr:V-type ATP synthase subunit E [Candidatus Gracilibacteria bacterium]MCF7819270.1 V-type ATP synthase subunit E [Candidatus Gracilibacteria bacterium]
MALQDILKRILDEAHAEVKKIQDDAEKQKKVLREESDQMEKKELEALNKKTQTVLDSVENKMQSMARRENAQLLLATKQKLIHQAMEEFLKSLENANDKMYGQILEKLFDALPLSSGKVFAPPKRLEITSQFAPGGFDVVAHKDVHGGFIVRAGGSEIDNSFRNLVFGEFRSELVSYFAEQLKLV